MLPLRLAVVSQRPYAPLHCYGPAPYSFRIKLVVAPLTTLKPLFLCHLSALPVFIASLCTAFQRRREIFCYQPPMGKFRNST